MYQTLGLDIRTVREGIRENYPSFKTATQNAVNSGIYGYMAKTDDGQYIAHDWAIAGRRIPKLMVMRVNPRPIPASLITSLDIVRTTDRGVIVLGHDKEEIEVVLYASMRYHSLKLHTEANLFHHKLIKELSIKGLY